MKLNMNTSGALRNLVTFFTPCFSSSTCAYKWRQLRLNLDLNSMSGSEYPVSNGTNHSPRSKHPRKKILDPNANPGKLEES